MTFDLDPSLVTGEVGHLSVIKQNHGTNSGVSLTALLTVYLIVYFLL